MFWLSRLIDTIAWFVVARGLHFFKKIKFSKKYEARGFLISAFLNLICRFTHFAIEFMNFQPSPISYRSISIVLPPRFIVWFIFFQFLFFSGDVYSAPKYHAKPHLNTENEPSVKKATPNPYAVKWVDSILNKMTFKKMVAQTLMIPAWTRDEMMDPSVHYAVENLGIGGVIFFQGTPQTHIDAVNFLQQQAQIPLLIGMDAEWGPAMRLDHIEKFPYALTIGASNNPKLAYLSAKYQAKQLKLLGVHINFAPVVDLNTNPNNPVIGFRSFGDNPMTVSKLASAFNEGLESEGIWGCAKHFPGHGNTFVDSHKDLPVVNHTPTSLQKDLIPFEALIQNGVKSVMVAHLKIPLLDTTSNMPASLSRPIVTELLREELQFDGLIFTDAMNMKGISKFYSPVSAGIMALKAGNDVLCFPDQIEKIIDSADKAMRLGILDSIQIAQSVRRILMAKYELGLSQFAPLSPEKIEEKMNSIYQEFVQLGGKEITGSDLNFAQQSICIRNNNEDLLPLMPFQNDTVWLVAFGKTITQPLLDRIRNYAHVGIIWAHHYSDAQDLLDYIQSKKGVKIVFNGAQKMFSNQPRELPSNLLEFLRLTNYTDQIVFVHVGNAYALQKLDVPVLTVLGFETGSAYQEAAIDAIFGEFGVKGTLPVAINSQYHRGNNFSTNPWSQSLEWHPLATTQGHDLRKKLDLIMDSMMAEKVTQTAQLLVLKEGKVMVDISRGTYTTPALKNAQIPVSRNTPYDIASVTKTMGMTLAIMKLYDQKKIKLHEPIGKYLKEARKTAWGEIPIHQFLLHRTGLPATLPLMRDLKNFKNSAYAELLEKYPYLNIDSMGSILVPASPNKMNLEEKDHSFGDPNHYHEEIPLNIPLSDQWLVQQELSQIVWDMIKRVEPTVEFDKKNPPAMIYSDLNAVILGKLVEHLTRMSLDDYLKQVYYLPMGLLRTQYLPHTTSLKNIVPPTEIDKNSPRGLIQGYVHDPTASLLGGVSGNAGLFSSAEDLAKLMQMLLNEGEWDGKRYLKSSTVDLFTETFEQGDNYRGLGFDKPNGYPNCTLNPEIKGSNLFDYAPRGIFGHTGFTGIWCFADKGTGTVFIFLSNRTYPNDTQNLLAKKGYRGKLFSTVYGFLK